MSRITARRTSRRRCSAAAAAGLAWVVAKAVFGLPQPFLAPWAALLTVHATVYRTFARGLQQVGAAVLGVLLAFAAGAVFGVNAASLGVMLLLAMAAGTTRALRDESTLQRPPRSSSCWPATAATWACSGGGSRTR